MRDVEPQHGKQSLPLVARAENPLRDVSAAARLRSRIPERPPLHAEIHAESNHRQSPECFAGEALRKIRKKPERICAAIFGAQCGDLADHRVHAAGGLHGVLGDADHDGHLQHELKQVRPQHAPKPAQRNVKARERNQKENANDQRQAVSAGKYRAKNSCKACGHALKKMPLADRGPSVVPTMLIIALVTQPRIRQFISRPR